MLLHRSSVVATAMHFPASLAVVESERPQCVACRRPCLLSQPTRLLNGLYHGRLVRGVRVSSRRALHTTARASSADGADSPLLPLPVPLVGGTAGMLAHLIASGQSYLVQSAAEQRLLTLAAQVQEDKECRARDSVGDVDDISVLQRRMENIRQKDIVLEAENLLYLCCVGRLHEQGITLQPSIQNGVNSSVVQCAMKVLPPALVDAVEGQLAASLGSGSMQLNSAARVAREQLAGLYLGTVEFGYFLHAVQSRMEVAGKSLGADSTNLLLFAETLSERELREVTHIRHQETFDAALLHVAHFFALEPIPMAAEGAGPEEAYPQLKPLAGTQIAPTAHLLEHFDDPSSIDALRSGAESKASRGWSDAAERDVREADNALPIPDLVEASVGELSALLLEAAVFGYALWEAEYQCSPAFPLRRRSPPGLSEEQ